MRLVLWFLKRVVTVSTTLALIAGGLIALSTTQAKAAIAGQFEPGLIIDDALFYRGDAMSVAEIQGFLSQKGSFLATYTETTVTKQAGFYSDSGNASGWGVCSQYEGAPNESAATIIFKVQVACGISAKVLLATLQKESSLVTSGTSVNLRSAMGYACPDTAACSSLYYGFFNQMYGAARSFQWYGNPAPGAHSSKRFAIGTWTIQFKANTPACGSQTVYVQNRATAALYYYTPYIPNAAAMNNLYGVGDVCSSYGNRNFWRIYSDWFGPTRAGSLMRTETDPTVYLIGESKKYPVASLDTLAALSPLGPVTLVSSTYLNTYATGQLATRVIRDGSGSLYFVDSGIKLPFTDCGMVADYGASCAGDYMQLTNDQASKFVSGSSVTSVVRTTSGATYFIDSGARREAADEASLVAAGVSVAANALSDASIRYLPLAAPLPRDSAIVFSSSGGFLLSEGKRYSVGGADAYSLGLIKLFAGRLTHESLLMIPDGGRFPGLVEVSGDTFVLSKGGLLKVTNSTAFSSLPSVEIDAAAASRLGVVGDLTQGSFVKSESSATVFLLDRDDLKPIGAWESLLALTPMGQNPVIHVIPQQVIESTPSGVVALTSGNMYRDQRSSTVYLVNGVSNKIPLSSFLIAAAIGSTRFSFTSTDRLDAYPLAPEVLSFGVRCGTTNYIGVEGRLREVPSSKAANFPFSFVELDPYLCARLAFGTVAGDFIRTPDGSIYALRAGKKYPILSMASFVAQASGQPWMNVESLFAGQIPNG